MLQQVTRQQVTRPVGEPASPATLAALGATRRLAEFLAPLRFEDLPATVVEAAQILVLDLVGCAFGARGSEEFRIATEVFRELGGREECSVLGGDFRTSCQNAAYLNGLVAHVIEMDDTHRESITHVGAAVIPAALAMAERQGADGRAFLTAVVVGYEACLRVANAVQPSHWRGGFLSMGTCGTFGAAAAAAHLLGLDADRLCDAFGLAGMQAAGLNSSIYGDGDMGKRLCPGHAAGAGVLSALLAAKGFTGSRQIIEQRKGFCESFARDYDLSRVTADLGVVWETARTSLKPYSCCRYNHAPIDGLMDILDAESVGPDEIGSMTVRTYDIAAVNRPHRTEPLTLFDAQMSIPFSLAVAAHKRAIGHGEFTADLILDPDLQAFARRVRVEADPEMSKAFPREWPAEIEVVLRDGRRFMRRVERPKGEPEAAMTRAEVEAKFRGLADAAITRPAAEAVMAAVWAMDRGADVAALMQAARAGLRG